jgi:hypothetical protein
MQDTSASPFAGVIGLGPLVSQHPVSGRSRWGSIVVGLVALAAAPLLVGLAVMIYIELSRAKGPAAAVERWFEFSWPVLAGLAALALGGWLLFSTARNWNTAAALYEHGLALNDHTGLRQIRWDAVDGVWQSVTKHYTNGIYTGTTYLYTVQTNDGQKLKFDNKFAKIEELGLAIQKQVSNALFPRYVERLNNGQRLTFGPLAIDLQGIYSGSKSLRWSEIKAVKIQSGNISIKKEGGWFNWASVSVPQVPNFWIFYEIVSRLTKVE